MSLISFRFVGFSQIFDSLVDATSVSVGAKLGRVQPRVCGPVGGRPPYSGFMMDSQRNTSLQVYQWLLNYSWMFGT